MSDGHFDAKIERLVSGLIGRMSDKSGNASPLNWEMADDDTFELTLTKSSIRIYTKDSDGVAPFIMRILDEQGRVVEEVREEGDGMSPYYRLDDLYRLASRSYRGVDEKLSEILGELGIPDTLGTGPVEPWNPSGSAGNTEDPF